MKTVCWMQSELPSNFHGVRYELSGWCYMESCISAAIKVGSNRLDLGKRTDEAMKFNYTHDGPYLANKLTGVCAARRHPPLLPAKVKSQLESEKTFTNSSDTQMVAALYNRFFQSVCTTTKLVFHELQWGPEDVEFLIAVLPNFKHLTELDLSNNRFGIQGAQHISEALKTNKSLTLLK